MAGSIPLLKGGTGIDIDTLVARMRAHGAELIGEMQYENSYRPADLRGPEGIIVALAEQPG
jgi:hypothetical protein